MRKTPNSAISAQSSGSSGLYSMLQPELAASFHHRVRAFSGGLSAVMLPESQCFTHKLHMQTLPRSTSTSTGSSAPAPPLRPGDFASLYKLELRAQAAKAFLLPCDYPMLSDVAGNALAKEIAQSVIFSATRQREHALPWNSILLFGPPGVGKTMLMRAFFNELGKKAGFACLSPSLSDLTSKYVGESERLLKSLFTLAREKSPSVIIFDEMDSLIRKRSHSENEAERRIKTEFMRQMDELKGVLVIGTTNMPWELDLAALKRFQRRILVPMPNREERHNIISMRLGDTWDLSDSELAHVLEMTEGYSGSDLDIACNEALLRAVKAADAAKFVRKIGSEEKQCWIPCDPDDPGAVDKNKADFLAFGAHVGQVTASLLQASLRNCRPTVVADILPLYTDFLRDYGLGEQANLAPGRVLEYFC